MNFNCLSKQSAHFILRPTFSKIGQGVEKIQQGREKLRQGGVCGGNVHASTGLVPLECWTDTCNLMLFCCPFMFEIISLFFSFRPCLDGIFQHVQEENSWGQADKYHKGLAKEILSSYKHTGCISPWWEFSSLSVALSGQDKWFSGNYPAGKAHSTLQHTPWRWVCKIKPVCP